MLVLLADLLACRVAVILAQVKTEDLDAGEMAALYDDARAFLKAYAGGRGRI